MDSSPKGLTAPHLVKVGLGCAGGLEAGDATAGPKGSLSLTPPSKFSPAQKWGLVSPWGHTLHPGARMLNHQLKLCRYCAVWPWTALSVGRSWHFLKVCSTKYLVGRGLCKNGVLWSKEFGQHISAITLEYTMHSKNIKGSEKSRRQGIHFALTGHVPNFLDHETVSLWQNYYFNKIERS